MILFRIKTLVMTEVYLRLRRLSSLVTLLAVAASAWLIFPDPSTGSTFIAVNNAQVRDTSAAIALGSACMFSLLYGLAGFYLTRGRCAEDLRCGIGSIIGSSTINNTTFLLCRWLGGVVYLVTMAGVFLLSVLACHLLRGVGPLQLGMYLETYLLVLVPMICLSVSCAVLFDSVPLLMGKFGDVIFFVIWVVQFSVIASIDPHRAPDWQSPWLFDFSGLGVSVRALSDQMHTDVISFGMTDFDRKLAAITLRDDLWSPTLFALRAATSALGCAVLLPAFLLFHRYSSDKVKGGHAVRRRSPIQLVNKLLRPITVVVQPSFELAARTPGLVGAALAELTLTLCTSPVAILLLGILSLVSVFIHYSALPGLLAVSVACWGVLISEIGSRDFSNGCEGLTGAVDGGIALRYVRQLIATVLLGLLFVAVIMLRLAFLNPLLAVALLVGVCSLSALAQLFGRLARTPRLFLSLFLFWMYVATQVPKEPVLDVVGFNGAVDVASVLMQFCIAVCATVGGYWFTTRTAQN